MMEFLTMLVFGLLMLLVGLILGGMLYQHAAEKEADAGVLKLGTKLYRTKPLKLAKDD